MPVTLNLTSADVIHGFWVPAMRLKNDTVPGLVTTIRFTPRLAGRYPIICTQFCGVLHSEMDKQVLVIEPKASFDKWYKTLAREERAREQRAAGRGGQAISLQGGSAPAGKQLFAQKCTACHKLAPFNQVLVGPGLQGVLHDPSHPNLVNGHPATPAERGGDPAERLHRQHGHDAERERQRPVVEGYCEPGRISRHAEVRESKAMAVAAVHPGGIADHIHPEPQGFVRRYVFSLDHKIIGIQYIITGFVFFMLSGLLAEAIRTQLLNPNGGFVAPDTYNEVYSVHGSAMVWLVVIPAADRRLRQPRHAAADRRARRRLPVAQHAQLLDLPGRRA